MLSRHGVSRVALRSSSSPPSIPAAQHSHPPPNQHTHLHQVLRSCHQVTHSHMLVQAAPARLTARPQPAAAAHVRHRHCAPHLQGQQSGGVKVDCLKASIGAIGTQQQRRGATCAATRLAMHAMQRCAVDEGDGDDSPIARGRLHLLGGICAGLIPWRHESPLLLCSRWWLWRQRLRLAARRQRHAHRHARLRQAAECDAQQRTLWQPDRIMQPPEARRARRQVQRRAALQLCSSIARAAAMQAVAPRLQPQWPASTIHSGDQHHQIRGEGLGDSCVCAAAAGAVSDAIAAATAAAIAAAAAAALTHLCPHLSCRWRQEERFHAR